MIWSTSPETGVCGWWQSKLKLGMVPVADNDHLIFLVGLWWQQPRLPYPQSQIPALPERSPDILNPTGTYTLSSRFWVCPKVSVQCNMPDTTLAGESLYNSRGHPFKLPKSPKLALINSEEHWVYSEALPDCHHPIRKSKPTNSAVEPHFHCLYSQPYYFSHYPQLVTIGEDRHVNWSVKRELSPQTVLWLHHHRPWGTHLRGHTKTDPNDPHERYEKD